MRYTLSRHGMSAEVDSHGGELISFRDRSKAEYIWSGDPAYWPGRNPILFPIIGSLKNGQVSIGGNVYKMPRHGFSRDCEFSLADQSADSITLMLRESEATLAQYPFPFLLQVCHRITDSGFSTTFRVENPGSRILPFCIGAHTAFRCPLHAGERFEDYAIVFDRPLTASTRLLNSEGLARNMREPVLDGQDRFRLDRSIFERFDTLIFDDSPITAASLLHQNTGHGVRMEFPDFPTLAIWTKSGAAAPFLCLEPWHGCAAFEDESGCFSEKAACVLLPPGETRSFTYTVTVQ